MKTVDIGRLGETLAAKHLKKQGYRIIAKNAKISYNELDLIALVGHDIVFVEVKARTVGEDMYSSYGSPASAVTKSKQSHLLAAATQYLRAHPRYAARQPRFDVVEVYLDKETHSVLQIHHIQNAFGRH